MSGKHDLYPEDRERQDPAVYLDAYYGWVREVPGSRNPAIVYGWYTTQSVLTDREVIL